MLALSQPLSADQVGEIVRTVRDATRSSVDALVRPIPGAERPGLGAIWAGGGLEPVGEELFAERRDGGGSTSPIYVSHSEADRDALILRPLAWVDATSDAETLRELLLEAPLLPTGGFALAPLGDQELVVFLEHLATDRLDASELGTALSSARLAGRALGTGVGGEREERAAPAAAAVAEAIDLHLLARPTGWARAPGRDRQRGAWIREGESPIAACYDAERGILLVARELRSFLGNPPLETSAQLLRKNLSLLDGSLAAIRHRAQGALVILSRLACDDLDDVELERCVSFVERLRIRGTRQRSAPELLGILERARPAAAGTSAAQANRIPAPPGAARVPAPAWKDELELGRLPSGDTLRIPAADLLTHAFVCGSSGSGKTIACKSLVEELALAGVPSIVIDLKGDLSSLACTPPAADVDAISRYLVHLYGKDAERLTAEIAQAAQRAASLHAEWETEPDALEAFRRHVRYRILAPRSEHAIPLALPPLARLELAALGDSGGIVGNQKLHELVEANLRNLVEHLDLSDGDAETLIAALTQLLEVAYQQGLALQGIEGIETLVRLLHGIEEHTETINFLPTSAAIDPKQAIRYARAMNARLGGTFRYWFDGEALSIDELVAVSDGRVPINVINLSMLHSPADQAYAIAQVSSQIIEWMRRQPGAQRPRLLYYIDEIAQDGGKGAIFPPHPYNPITKPGLTVLLKQGRAFGVSCLLATQNAKDIDYKGLGQCDTWIVGRLKTAADIERLKLGMEAAQVEATHAFSDQADDIVAQVSGLEPGQLVVKTRSAGVQTYRQRWVRSLHERMTPAMLENWLRAEEIGIERAITAAQERWSRGEAEAAIAALEATIAAEPYYSRLAPATLQLCEWLYRTKQWPRLADCAASLRETVRSRSGFELVHYYEGMAHYETGHLGRAREALERFVAQAAAGSGELAERCRDCLLRIFVAQDDYDRLEEAVEAGEVQGGRSRLLEFCGAMKTALTSWPSLRGGLDDATVITGEEAGEIRYARKGDQSVHGYVAEVRRRLDDLLVAGPEIPPFDGEASAIGRAVAERIAADTEAQRAQEAQLGEALAAAEAEIDRGELADASSHIEAARKLVAESGLASDGLERVISLYRGAFAAGRESFRGWLLGLDPIQFELETAALFRSLGYEAQATKASGDGGVDVMATYQNRHYVIQCKRYRHPIQPDQIRAFATAIRNFDADEGIFVATSTFSDGCREEAERHGIRLVDLDGLVRLYGGEPGRRKTDARAEPREERSGRRRARSR